MLNGRWSVSFVLDQLMFLPIGMFVLFIISQCCVHLNRQTRIVLFRMYICVFSLMSLFCVDI